MAQLNFHHLNYFRAVARAGSLTGAARQLHISQSALSTQIRQLEDRLGQALFERRGRSLVLTEAGRIALDYAESIHASASELLAVLRDGGGPARKLLRIGAVATLSRNFQESFVEPLLGRDDVTLVLHSGSLGELLTRLSAHQLDLVLSNRRVDADAEHPWRCRRIARQAVSLVGQPRRRGKALRFPQDLHGLPLLLPGPDSDLRAAFDLLCEQHGVRVRVLAEVDDMALLRVLARAASAPAVVPRVVVRDELRSGALQEYCVLPNLHEDFFAIAVRRQYQHPLIRGLLARSESEVLAI
ncbi:MAG TPA: LysR family transcriptional regulator [Rhodanobacteraceae bacterium]|nr:LysR family transcriptional regulator [Rhodanobacteraceae bacterium]